MYLNKFHQESVERQRKSIQEMKKTPINCEEELQKHFKMHELLRKQEEAGEKEKLNN